MAKIDVAFANTSSLILGRKLFPIEDYSIWLSSRIPKVEHVKSCISGRQLLVPNYSIFPHLPKENLVGLEDFESASKIEIKAGESDSISSISSKLASQMKFAAEFTQGENLDVIGSIIYLNLSDAYKIIDCFNSKHIAFSFFCDNCDHVFGSYKAFDSKFSIHCYNSKNLNLCFECDSCRNCSGLMFCHNCENVRDSLFCSNVKNLRYAVANQVVGREKYLELRKMLCEYVITELESKHGLDFNVFNFCSFKKK